MTNQVASWDGDLALEFKNIYDYLQFMNSGWIDANETWTYASASTYSNTNTTYGGTFTIVGDKTSKYSAGMKIKFDQTTDGTKYGIITKVSYSSPNTTITVFFGTDYDIDNETISNPYYSTAKSPQGFPMIVNKWTIETTDSTLRSQTSPVQNTWYNTGAITIDIPIGNWIVYYQGNPYAEDTSATTTGQTQITLSTANNTESDSEMTRTNELFGASGTLAILTPAFAEKEITVTADDTYYLNQRTKSSGIAAIRMRNDYSPAVIRARLNYL